jgi:nucleoside-diphosphate-sugar epimerase
MDKNMNKILEKDNLHLFEHLEKDLKALKGSTVLVAGSKGFLGKTITGFINFLNENKFEDKDMINLIAIDYEEHDICKSLEDFIEDQTVDYIINCAGIASPQKYLKVPVKTMDVSYLGTKNIFEFARKRNTKSILMFSSSEVYGTPDPSNIPTKESYVGSVTTFGNRSCYDIGKNILETLSYVYHDYYNLPVNVLRPFNLYGPLMNFNDGRIIPNICKAMIEKRDFSVYGNGKQTRTYCYVADAVVYMFKVLLSNKFGEVYNVGSEDEELSALEIAKRSYDIINPETSSYKIQPHPEGYPDNEPTRRKPDISKVKLISGYSPKYKFKNGLESCYSYFCDVYVAK